MIGDLLKLSPAAAKEIKACLPSNDMDGVAAYDCRFLLDDLTSSPEQRLSDMETHKAIIDIAAALAERFSASALALALAYEGAGLSIRGRRRAGGNIDDVAKEERDRAMAVVDDFETALRVLKMSKSPRARQAAREAASAGRLAGAWRPRNLSL